MAPVVPLPPKAPVLFRMILYANSTLEGISVAAAFLGLPSSSAMAAPAPAPTPRPADPNPPRLITGDFDRDEGDGEAAAFFGGVTVLTARPRPLGDLGSLLADVEEEEEDEDEDEEEDDDEDASTAADFLVGD
jgi:hypothetical protein